MRRATRHFLVCAACVLVASGAAAQTVSAGVKAGMVLTSVPQAGDVLDQISGVESVDVRTKSGVTGGGFVQFTFNNRFSFQPELLFVMKGVQLDLRDDTGTVSASLNYIEFPLLARFRATLNDTVDGYIVVGPSFSVKTGTGSKLDGAGGSEDLNIDPAFGSRDFGLAFGGGIERSRYLLDARYTMGLTDVATDIYQHNDPLKNRAFSVMIGIRLP